MPDARLGLKVFSYEFCGWCWPFLSLTRVCATPLTRAPKT